MTALDTLLARHAVIRRLPAPPVRRLLREQAGISQVELAQLLGVNRAAVSRYESGQRTPRSPIAERYVRLLDRLVAGQ